jgi:proteasome assembly chaperone (PAC2) family protein
MGYATILIKEMPALRSPSLIIGLRGWDNALEVSADMAAYLVDQHQGRSIGHIHSDACYRYDENRPIIKIENGELKAIQCPGGRLFAVQSSGDNNKDLLILIADEPHINWHCFSSEVVDLAITFGATSVITLGSLLDHVLHMDRIITAAATGVDYSDVFKRYHVGPVNYHGPCSIHNLILDQCRKREIAGVSLWGHCPAYVQGITHYGLMIHLGRLLAEMIPFPIQIDGLQTRWKDVKVEIQQLIKENPKLEAIMEEIRKKKRAGAWQNLDQSGKTKGNVISLEAFRGVSGQSLSGSNQQPPYKNS